LIPFHWRLIPRPFLWAKLDPQNQHGLSGAGFNVMLRRDHSIHWITMPFFAVDSAVEPQNDTFERASMGIFRYGLLAQKLWVKFSPMGRPGGGGGID